MWKPFMNVQCWATVSCLLAKGLGGHLGTGGLLHSEGDTILTHIGRNSQHKDQFKHIQWVHVVFTYISVELLQIFFHLCCSKWKHQKIWDTSNFLPQGSYLALSKSLHHSQPCFLTYKTQYLDWGILTGFKGTELKAMWWAELLTQKLACLI